MTFIDIDDFKSANDALGHEAGDRLLVAVAERLRDALRAEDTVARTGGDEFVALVEGADASAVEETIAPRLAAALSERFDIGGRSLVIRASMGTTVHRGGDSSPSELLAEADIAMYETKRTRRGAHLTFAPRMQRRASKQLDIESGLRRALDQASFELRYQPIVDVLTGRLAGVEALLRWRDGRGREVPPSEFIPVAERTGLIVPIGRWVLRRALSDARWARRQLPDEPQIALTVNLSVPEFEQPELEAEVEAALDGSGLAADNLILEITEGALAPDVGRVSERLSALKRLGVRVALDDFGTGYSSLSYLHRFPVDILKIDKSFIDRIDRRGRGGAELTEVVIALGSALGMAVIAEGVEQEHQLAALRQLECGLAQGYYFSRPLTRERLVSWARERLITGSAAGASTLPGRT